MQPKYLIVIVGPTAVGKTSLSVDLAKELNTEIISADSRQLFKEISIGTAKPSKEEMQDVVHHFIDSHSIHENFNAGQFEEEAIELISQLFKKYNTLILVGGSGLYIDAICNGFDALPKSDGKIRERLNDIYKNEGIEKLKELLLRYDPEHYKKTDLHNPHRMIRAIEVSMISGLPYSSFRKNEKNERDFNIIKIGLHLEREKLYAKINSRVDEMIKNGLLKEVQELFSEKKIKKNEPIPNALNTVGYKELIGYINGEYNLERAIELIKQNTRHFAKRQLTWFKKHEDISWFSPESKKDIQRFIEEKIHP